MTLWYKISSGKIGATIVANQRFFRKKKQVAAEYSPFTELRNNTQEVRNKCSALVAREINARKEQQQSQKTAVGLRLESNAPVHTFAEIEADYRTHHNIELTKDQRNTIKQQLLYIGSVNEGLSRTLWEYLKLTEDFIREREAGIPLSVLGNVTRPIRPEEEAMAPKAPVKSLLKNPDTFERKMYHILQYNAAETFDNKCTVNASPAFKSIMEYAHDKKFFTNPPIPAGGLRKNLEFATPFQAMEYKIARDMEKTFGICDKHQEARLLLFYCWDAARRAKDVKHNALLEGQIGAESKSYVLWTLHNWYKSSFLKGRFVLNVFFSSKK